VFAPGVRGNFGGVIKNAAEHSEHVAVQCGAGQAESDTCDGSGCIRSDAGERADVFKRGWKLARFDDPLGRFLEIPRPVIVTQPGPAGEQLGFRRRGERFDVWELLKEPLVVRDGGSDTRLLKHDFGDPDGVRIAGAAPGQVAFPNVVPSEQCGAKAGGVDGSRTRLASYTGEETAFRPIFLPFHRIMSEASSLASCEFSTDATEPARPVLAIRGARVHNLKNINLDIPHNELTVVTGVSGSGKSSLVFDTIYAEGQRRYVESLSAYARQFLERMEKPEIDEILGIAPPIAIRQKNQTRNPRSTVATATELYDYMRLLWARAGWTYCPNDGSRIQRDSVDQVAEAMLKQPGGSRWYALFPVRAKAEGGADAQRMRDRLFELRQRGFNRLFQRGKMFEFSTPESLLDIDFASPLFVLADRLAIRPDIHQRIADTVEVCYREAGEVFFEQAGVADPSQMHFSEAFACKVCGLIATPPEPSLFSFNNPMGACPKCQGFGNTIDYDLDLIIPDPALSLEEGAVDPWTKPQYGWYYEEEFRPKARGKARLNIPYADLKAEEKEFVRKHIQRFFEEVEKKKYKVHVRVFISRYRAYTQCPACRGARLRPEALWVRVGGCDIAQVAAMSIAQAHAFFDGLKLNPEEASIAERVLGEIRQRCKFLNDVGLEYLTLDRVSATLSGGEAQRIQLATCLGSRLTGAVYVLDEPSIGLHSRDTARLTHILKDLRELGNTIIVVEHDPEIMAEADHIVDLGPGAGENGGRVIFEGNYAQLLAPQPGREAREQSLTGRYLRGELSVSRVLERRRVHSKRTLRFLGARANNLKNIDVEIPLGMMTVVTGVSGSGKSSLLHEVIYRALDLHVNRARESNPETEEETTAVKRLPLRQLERAELLTGVVLVDQSPIGRTPRSNPVTYIKAFDLIRDIFASTPEAQRRGYTPGHFSFNIPGGRCETCQGDGVVTVEMQFLADVELVCEECKGTRFKSSVLDVRYKGLNIHEVLQLTVREALSFFSASPRLVSRLKVLYDVGLGYLRLGQSATTLSGGEAQRVKLAAHLAQASCEGTLFLFDEPTTGLHFDDISKLLQAFERLIQSGGSVLVIEHNLDLIKAADWIIDLGPEGGEAGGRIVAQGTPETVAGIAESYTGQYLKHALAQRAIA
jgi:excinuclease ABC subunit A